MQAQQSGGGIDPEMTQLATSPANRWVRKIGFLLRRLTRQPAVVAGAVLDFVASRRPETAKSSARELAEPVVVRKRESVRWVR